MKFKSPYGVVRDVDQVNAEAYEKSGWAPVEAKPKKPHATKPRPEKAATDVPPPATPDPAPTPE